jgi:hypothetical protein
MHWRWRSRLKCEPTGSGGGRKQVAARPSLTEEAILPRAQCSAPVAYKALTLTEEPGLQEARPIISS